MEVYNCYAQIEACESLLETIKTLSSKDKGGLIDERGNIRPLELGIPSGQGSHRIVRVDIDLGVDATLRAIEKQKIRLSELKGIAKAELA